MISKPSRILVVVAHPDDEVLGVGGTVHKMTADHNIPCGALILGEGITSRYNKASSEQQEQLNVHQSNIKMACSHLGYEYVETRQFPDNRFDRVDLLDIVKEIEYCIGQFAPDTIITHHGGDVNIDHKLTFQAVLAATRPLPETGVLNVFTLETMSGTEWQSKTDPFVFKPTIYVELQEHNLEAKINAMESYQFEKRPYPHPRSPEALRIKAQIRGIESGFPLAEAFGVSRVSTPVSL